MKKVRLKEIKSGDWCKIYAYGTKKQCPVFDFFKEQQKERPKELAKLLATLQTTVNNGPPKNKQKCNSLGDKLFEFKTTGGLRLVFFWDCNRIIVTTHGFLKKTNKTPPGQKEMAMKIMKEYFEAKEHDCIETEGSD